MSALSYCVVGKDMLFDQDILFDYFMFDFCFGCDDFSIVYL